MKGLPDFFLLSPAGMLRTIPQGIVRLSKKEVEKKGEDEHKFSSLLKKKNKKKSKREERRWLRNTHCILVIP